VRINGEGPFRFVVDTGANRSVLAPQVAKRLGLTPNEESAVNLSGVTGTGIVGTVPIRSLEVGDLVLENVELPVVAATVKGVDGILGVEGFEDMRLTVDFTKDSIKIERSRSQRAQRGYYTLPVRFRHGRLLVVEAIVGRVPARAVIDTGAEGTLGTERLRDAIYRNLVRGDKNGRASVQGVTADIQFGDLLNAPTIHFEGIEIEGIKIAYGVFHVFDIWDLQRQPALLVGMDIIGTLEVLVIDYRRRELQVRPRAQLIHRGFQ